MATLEQDIQDQQEMIKILVAHNKELRSINGVTSTGVGIRRVNGQFTDEVCIFVEVEKKLPPELLEAGQLIPGTVGGVNVDVVERNQFVPALKKVKPEELAATLPDTPLMGGDYISNLVKDGNGDIYMGTLGAMVYVPVKCGHDYIAMLTCHHVLYNDKTQVGQNVYRPQISETDVAANITTGQVDNSNSTMVDFCLAKMADHHTCSNDVKKIGTLTGIGQNGLIAANQVIRKYGVTTDITTGIINAMHITEDGPVFGSEILYFTVIAAEIVNGNAIPRPQRMFADEGDSGSVAVDQSNKVQGIVVAIGEEDDPNDPKAPKIKFTYVSYIPYVMSKYGDVNIPVPSSSQLWNVLTDTDRLNTYRDLLQQTEPGRNIINAISSNIDECTVLNNEQRACMVAWQRNKGTAFISLTKEAGNNGPYLLQKEVDGVKLEDMITNMADVYIQNGSSHLAETMKTYAPLLAGFVKESNTVEDVVKAISSAQQP